MRREEARYHSAVERNLRNAQARTAKYAGMDIEQAKRRLGVRQHDTSYDEAVRVLCYAPLVKQGVRA